MHQAWEHSRGQYILLPLRFDTPFSCWCLPLLRLALGLPEPVVALQTGADRCSGKFTTTQKWQISREGGNLSWPSYLPKVLRGFSFRSPSGQKSGFSAKYTTAVAVLSLGTTVMLHSLYKFYVLPSRAVHKNACCM